MRLRIARSTRHRSLVEAADKHEEDRHAPHGSRKPRNRPRHPRNFRRRDEPAPGTRLSFKRFRLVDRVALPSTKAKAAPAHSAPIRQNVQMVRFPDSLGISVWARFREREGSDLLPSLLSFCVNARSALSWQSLYVFIGK